MAPPHPFAATAYGPFSHGNPITPQRPQPETAPKRVLPTRAALYRRHEKAIAGLTPGVPPNGGLWSTDHSYNLHNFPLPLELSNVPLRDVREDSEGERSDLEDSSDKASRMRFPKDAMDKSDNTSSNVPAQPQAPTVETVETEVEPVCANVAETVAETAAKSTNEPIAEPVPEPTLKDPAEAFAKLALTNTAADSSGVQNLDKAKSPLDTHLTEKPSSKHSAAELVAKPATEYTANHVSEPAVDSTTADTSKQSKRTPRYRTREELIQFLGEAYMASLRSGDRAAMQPPTLPTNTTNPKCFCPIDHGRLSNAVRLQLRKNLTSILNPSLEVTNERILSPRYVTRDMCVEIRSILNMLLDECNFKDFFEKDTGADNHVDGDTSNNHSYNTVPYNAHGAGHSVGGNVSHGANYNANRSANSSIHNPEHNIHQHASHTTANTMQHVHQPSSRDPRPAAAHNNNLPSHLDTGLNEPLTRHREWTDRKGATFTIPELPTDPVTQQRKARIVDFPARADLARQTLLIDPMLYAKQLIEQHGRGFDEGVRKGVESALRDADTDLAKVFSDGYMIGYLDALKHVFGKDKTKGAVEGGEEREREGEGVGEGDGEDVIEEMLGEMRVPPFPPVPGYEPRGYRLGVDGDMQMETVLEGEEGLDEETGEWEVAGA